MKTATNTDQSELVILIHGTAAGDIEDSGERWWQLGSQTRQFLDDRLKGVAHCDTQPFHWSGENSQQERLNAATRLALIINDLESKQQKYHLVAHSHGGSVVWQML